ncbi:hypothetical protein [Bacillus weihaiensis]|uniref:Uncharacterized protein n=1 Tax=Bacillus weihaiensis TaxID=1547283 RepID=A0A1L3MTP1_9BACI|nr:hypothetical protein [Bacillus weihaiensis]APH05660.1 hypothetical protein A9C19_13370 [Bacillus weihaiensis]
MKNSESINVTEAVITIIDILVILMVDDNPIIGIVLVALLKVVTEDVRIRVLFILLLITLGVTDSQNGEEYSS